MASARSRLQPCLSNMEAEGLGVDVVLIDAGGDVDQIDMVLDQLGKLDAVLQRHAALDALGAGHTVLDEEVIAADLL